MKWFIVPIVALAPAVHAAEPIAVPYKLTDTKHVLVRVKLNGKGPFNFIIDTGAPALFVSTKAADKTGAKPGDDGWTTFDKLELEGGLSLTKARGKVDDLFQLKGMNAMGLAGVELHGVIGFNVLARYRIAYDFTTDKLLWTPLDFEPPPVVSLGGKGGQPGSLEAVGSIMQFLAPLLGMKANFATKPRGFLGIEIVESEDEAVVKKVLTDGPADKAGLKIGDKIIRFGEDKVRSSAEMLRRAADAPAGKKVLLKIVRAGKEEELSVELGKGL